MKHPRDGLGLGLGLAAGEGGDSTLSGHSEACECCEPTLAVRYSMRVYTVHGTYSVKVTADAFVLRAAR